MFQGTMYAGVCLSNFVFTLMSFLVLNIHWEQIQIPGNVQYNSVFNLF